MKYSFLLLILPAIGFTIAFPGINVRVLQTRDAVLGVVNRDGYELQKMGRRDDIGMLQRRGSCFSRNCPPDSRSQSRSRPVAASQASNSNPSRHDRTRPTSGLVTSAVAPSTPNRSTSPLAPFKAISGLKNAGSSRQANQSRKGSQSMPLKADTLSRQFDHEVPAKNPRQKVLDWLAASE